MLKPVIIKPIAMEHLMMDIDSMYYKQCYKIGCTVSTSEEAHILALSSTVSTPTARKVFIVRHYLNQGI